MASTSNPSTDPRTYPTTAEVEPFTPWLFRSLYPLDSSNQNVKCPNYPSLRGRNTKASRVVADVGVVPEPGAEGVKEQG